ncbi:gamma-glutamyl-gamma-aminobutyrate hydrolase family protein [Rubrobacter marinus]|uniref:Gamma-glutamyl-gamma-aminobutyrate hydrolase family protein n=1 Tax=Rubrobacter marinus TaxID=2653852 RepID=A0A6G8PVP9_9ACTN|nr:gamma-glutamyl-gamma-aminobutyrate hydrolase family protein [Rubrobacter marinus]QIN78276.1 gamma-glutamyl-gamma-aminobutyrate hydrolase family protein [Rubrobacter marinus]
MAPVIGVTATLKQDVEQRDTRPLGTYVRADLDYVAGVAQAGGVPVVLPPFVEAAEEMVRGIDGLLLSGGSDLDPSYYGESAIPELDVTLPERDVFEMALLEHALDRGLPVFGICRGLQVLNVAFGGTLYQDLPSQLNPALIAHRQLYPKWEWTHEVELEEGSATREIMAVPSSRVNSYHHQAVKDLAEPFRAVGRSVDGIVEAIEHRNLSERWIVAVQWHAEAMREGDVGPEHRNLFKAHVAAAERHALKRAAA